MQSVPGGWGSSGRHTGLGEGLRDEHGCGRRREVHQLAERGARVTKGSIRIHWGGQIASRNKDEEAGRNWGVLGWLICLPKRTGPDFTGGGCVAGDAISRSVFRERSLAVAWGGRERSWQSRWAEGYQTPSEMDCAGLGEG